MRGQTSDERWRRYVASYHDQRPAITERLLSHAGSTPDASPYAWLVESLRTVGGPILDLACGSAPTRALLTESRWLGVDASTGELNYAAGLDRGPLVRARADALPVAGGTVAAVCAAMCLPVLTPLDAVLGEITRVLRPGGLLAALVPARLDANPAQILAWLRIMRWLGTRGQPWPNPRARDGLPGVLRRAGFTVRASARRTFRVPVATETDAELLIEGLYLPDVDVSGVREATRRLAAWAGPGRQVAVPLRRGLAPGPVAG
jgi:SAM-dependent methyltransferase